MNVLLLTPDRVGSTFLQRMLTIYMLRQEFDKPVINLHELTNGLEKYISPTMNKEVLGKPTGTEWGYYQSLDEITDFLRSVDHYKTSRLAKYHIDKRKDSISDQIKFYEFLNENFFIISCRRENLLEHVLSWIISSHSKKLNVYNVEEKFNTFSEIYKNKITVSKEQIQRYLNDYKDYVEWSETYFNIQSYFNYEDSIDSIEKYIFSLDFMKEDPSNSWETIFGIDFDDWNKTHKLLSDLPLSAEDGDSKITPILLSKESWDNIKDSSWDDNIFYNNGFLETIDSRTIKNDLVNHKNFDTFMVSKEVEQFLTRNIVKYKNAQHQINDLVNNGFLVTPPPIKLQTFSEKKKLIKNFDECVKWFNQWVYENNFGKIFNKEDFIHFQELEESKFENFQKRLEN